LLPSASCSESYAILKEVSGRTLSGAAQFHAQEVHHNTGKNQR
jgi:hypothetical protein